MWSDLISNDLYNYVKIGICILLYACVVITCDAWYIIVGMGLKLGLH